jgi:hypothetical protein
MKTMTLLLTLLSFTVLAQKKAPKMAPLFDKGYYVSLRGDTVLGSIQTNPPDKTKYYSEFFFKPLKGGKARLFNTKRAKAYGFNDRHFVSVPYDDRKLFMERLASGRLVVLEYWSTVITER